MLCHFGATKWKWRNKLPDRQTGSQTNRRTNEQKYRDAQAGKQAGTCNNGGHYSKLVKNQGFLNQTTRVIQVNWSILKLKLRIFDLTGHIAIRFRSYVILVLP